MPRSIVDTLQCLEPDSSKRTGFRTRVKYIIQCDFCGWETIYDRRHLFKAKASPCRHCSDKGPVRRTPSGKISESRGRRDALRYGTYDLPESILHGVSSTNAYDSWTGMMSRCYQPNNSAYQDYGGRGIRVCQDWHNPLLFYCDMGDRPEGWSIERLDPDGDYCPENCVWTPRSDQAWMRRSTLAYAFPDLSRFEIRELSHSLQLEKGRARSKKRYVPRDNPVGRQPDLTKWYYAAGCPGMRRETYGPLQSAKCTQNRIRRFEEFWSSLS